MGIFKRLNALENEVVALKKNNVSSWAFAECKHDITELIDIHYHNGISAAFNKDTELTFDELEESMRKRFYLWKK